jgi:methionyl-tRNA synthetase
MIDPFASAEEWGVDAARYLVLREAPFEKDSPISPELLNARFNADLANGLGNLVSRTLAMVAQYASSRVPDAGTPGESERAVREAAERALREHDAAARELHFADALAAVFSLVDAANKHYQRTQPWQLAKSPTDRAALETALYAGLEAVRLVAYLLYPYTPGAADRITTQLGVPAASTSRWADVARWGLLRKGAPVTAGAPLFPRLERTTAA